MGKLFETNGMNLPDNEPLEGLPNKSLPYFLAGDEAFPLKIWLQQPYPGKTLEEKEMIFNHRLSCACRIIENAFGILVARWRRFKTRIPTSVETAESIIQAAICLHNYLCLTDSAAYCPAGFVDSEDRSGNTKKERRLAKHGSCWAR